MNMPHLPDYQYVAYLGKGKAGHSFLIEKNGVFYVCKNMHLQPYDHGQRFLVEDEIKAYDKLKTFDLPIPKLIDYDIGRQFLIKEYVEGKTLARMIADGDVRSELYGKFLPTIEAIEKSGHTIDYFPTNFVFSGRTLIYVDYEINPFEKAWSFRDWGIYFWFNTEGFKRYLDHDHDHSLLVKDDRPIEAMTEKDVFLFWKNIDDQKRNRLKEE